MLLNFKPCFVPFIQAGTKRHTIRAARAIPPKVGEICHCYTGLRRKGAKLLGRWPCVKVEDILIYTRGDGSFGVVVAGQGLDLHEKNGLAFADGFREVLGPPPFVQMMRYWISTHGDGSEIQVQDGEPLIVGNSKGIDFQGQIIHWDFDNPALEPARKRLRFNVGMR